jgi:hypothetical protein
VASCAILVVGGVLLLADAPTMPAARLRMALTGVGLGLGLATLLMGFSLAATTFWADIKLGIDEWRKQPGVLALPVAVYVVGLALMFFAVQPCLPLIREDQAVRRVVFGANLVVSSLLLIGVLALPTALSYAEPFSRFFGWSYDWTESDVYSLSKELRTTITGLQEPVKVYVLMPRGTVITSDTQTLLDNCRSLNPRFTWELVNPHAAENRDRLRGFMEKYTILDPSGLLVVTGSEDKGDHAFIKARDLYEEDMDRGGRRPGYIYKGDQVLYNALMSLVEGKMTIYFTQGHGELTLEAAPMGRMRPPARDGASLGVLRDKLTSRKSVEVKPLTVDRGLKKVPDDATIVVIARPTQEFSPDEVRALRDYAGRLRRAQRPDEEGEGQGRQGARVRAGDRRPADGPARPDHPPRGRPAGDGPDRPGGAARGVRGQAGQRPHPHRQPQPAQRPGRDGADQPGRGKRHRQGVQPRGGQPDAVLLPQRPHG